MPATLTLEQIAEARVEYYSSAISRAYKLEEGDTFAVFYKDEWLNLKFKNNLLYEVIKVEHDLKSPTGMVLIKGVYTEWKETGKYYTPDELNKMLMKESKRATND